MQAVGVMNQLALELDINSAVDNIRDVVLELLHCERVTLFLVDSQQKELRYEAVCCAACTGFDTPPYSPLRSLTTGHPHNK